MSQLSDRRSQAAIELMALVSLALIFLTLVFSFYMRERNATLEETLLMDARTRAYEVAGAIDQVYLGGDGYERNLTLPEVIGGYNYSISSSEGHVYLILPDFPMSVSGKIIPPNFTGNFSRGKNHRIANVGGSVGIFEA